jgi:hypothetical protein
MDAARASIFDNGGFSMDRMRELVDTLNAASRA